MIKDNKNFELVTENNLVGISNKLITLAAKTYNPSSVLGIIKQVENICQAQHDYMLPTMEKMFSVSEAGISHTWNNNLMSVDLVDECEFDNEGTDYYLLTINGTQNIRLEFVTVIEEEKKKFKIVEVEITRTSTSKTYVILNQDDDEDDAEEIVNNKFDFDDSDKWDRYEDQYDYDYRTVYDDLNKETCEDKADEYEAINARFYNYDVE